MRIDAQDAVLLLGVAAVLVGVAMWSVAAALVLFGLFCMGFVVLAEIGAGVMRARKAEKRRAD